jgi:phage terminase small subunit
VYNRLVLNLYCQKFSQFANFSSNVRHLCYLPDPLEIAAFEINPANARNVDATRAIAVLSAVLSAIRELTAAINSYNTRDVETSRRHQED